ncbi:MAG TPA: hypothetical protein VFR94_02000 [Nitrososphaeraceae archaeon]|nr:hypothetical protein [Nitrososphaeraceae archaeon]
MVGKSRGNKQLNKNAAKEKSTDSKRSKKMVKARQANHSSGNDMS